MEFNPENRKKLTKWLIGTIAACILIFLGVQNIGIIASALSWAMKLIMPLLLGFAFALILNVPMRFFETHLWPKTQRRIPCTLRRPAAYCVSLIMILGILAGVIWLVIPELVEAVKLIANSVIVFVRRLSAMDALELANQPFGNLLLKPDWDAILNTAESWLKDWHFIL
ncbi:MAG: hypothetical protein IJC39_04320 [Firmicutes bacterium]|nr:hypothetical protein [Bacillota bacterium]